MKLQAQLRTFFSRLNRKSRCRRRRFAASGTSAENLESRALLSSVSVSGTSLSFFADAGETNTVTISESGGIITIIDTTAPITAGAGVTVVNTNEVTIPTAGLVVINVNLGDLNDSLDMSAVGQIGSLRRTSLVGGDGDDIMIGSDLNDGFSESPGSDSIDGRGEITSDQWLVNSDINMTLTDAGLTIGSEFDTYANIEVVSLGGLASDNTIDASAVTAASGITSGINLTGRDGNDILIGAQGVRNSFQDFVGDNSFVGGSLSDSVPAFRDQDMTLTDSTFLIGTSVNTHVSVENFDMRGGPTGNIIDASAISMAGDVTTVQIIGDTGNDTLRGSYLNDTIRDTGGVNVLDGLGGSDILIIFGDTDQVLTDSTLSINGIVSTHANFEDVRLQGGAGNNILDSSAVTAASGINVVYLTGLAGNDSLLGGELNEILADNDGNNTIDGGGGVDRFTANGNVDMTAIDGTLFVGPYVNTFSNVEDLRMTGGAGDNVLDSSALTAASGVTTNVISSLTGNDTIRPSGDTGINSNLNGGDGAASGIDTLDLTQFPVTPNVNISGPGTSDGSLGNVGANISFNNMNLITLPPEYDFSAATYSAAEGDSPSPTNVVQVTRSVNTSIASSVDVVLTDGTATGGTDFTAGPITVSFLPGEVMKSVPIELLGDVDVEADEMLVLSFGNGISGVANPTAELTILNDDVSNLLPEILTVETDATFADKASSGDSVTLNATFSDPNATDIHTATIDWGDGTTTLGLVNQSTGEITGDHVYLSGGIFDVTVTIDDGIATDDAMTTAVVSGVRLTDDGTLQIIGTDDRDRVQVKHQGSNIRVKLKQANGPTQHHDFTASGITSILIHTCDGNDRIQLHHNIDLPTVINAGAGHDEIQGGSGDDLIRAGSGHDFVSGGQGHDIILGGEGHDLLFGDSGRDILIGGDEFDVAFGGSGEDILIGGSTIHDNDNAALNSIRDEWTSNKSLAIRKQNLIDGTGDGSGLNGTAFLDSLSLIDDNAFDLLFGGWGADWLPEH